MPNGNEKKGSRAKNDSGTARIDSSNTTSPPEYILKGVKEQPSGAGKPIYQHIAATVPASGEVDKKTGKPIKIDKTRIKKYPGYSE